ncbi:hypothetical protein GCM10018789_37000 [Streptomyces werraensis]|nr:hypothetical protein GCM10018789_37000 [Streptomyces werraensis]
MCAFARFAPKGDGDPSGTPPVSRLVPPVMPSHLIRVNGPAEACRSRTVPHPLVQRPGEDFRAASITTAARSCRDNKGLQS